MVRYRYEVLSIGSYASHSLAMPPVRAGVQVINNLRLLITVWPGLHTRRFSSCCGTTASASTYITSMRKLLTCYPR